MCMVQENPKCAITFNCVHEISTSDQGICEMSHQEHGVYQINRIFTESGETYQIHPLRIFLHDTMALDVRWPSLTAEAWVWFQATPYGVCGGIVKQGKGFLQILWFSPVSITPPLLIIHISLIHNWYYTILGTDIIISLWRQCCPAQYWWNMLLINFILLISS
jgi:hypothetical protein